MEAIEPDNWPKIATRLLARVSPKRIGIEYISSASDSFGKILSITVCGKRADLVFNKWSEKLQIAPKTDFPLRWGTATFQDIVKALKESPSTIERIAVCVRMLHKSRGHGYITKLFGRYFRIVGSHIKQRKFDINPDYYRHDWLVVYDSDVPEWVETLGIIDKPSALAIMLKET
jgi:hypothetical protein